MLKINAAQYTPQFGHILLDSPTDFKKVVHDLVYETLPLVNRIDQDALMRESSPPIHLTREQKVQKSLTPAQQVWRIQSLAELALASENSWTFDPLKLDRDVHLIRGSLLDGLDMRLTKTGTDDQLILTLRGSNRVKDPEGIEKAVAENLRKRRGVTGASAMIEVQADQDSTFMINVPEINNALSKAYGAIQLTAYHLAGRVEHPQAQAHIHSTEFFKGKQIIMGIEIVAKPDENDPLGIPPTVKVKPQENISVRFDRSGKLWLKLYYKPQDHIPALFNLTQTDWLQNQILRGMAYLMGGGVEGPNNDTLVIDPFNLRGIEDEEKTITEEMPAYGHDASTDSP